MAKEIERKFLVRDISILANYKGVKLVQGYMNETGMTTRVRIGGKQAWLTLKGAAKGLVRDEYEYRIPMKDAKEMLKNHCGTRIVTKTRYCIPVGNHIFEVDVFEGALAGLIMAEVEMRSAQETVALPLWLGEEVTGKRGFSNRALASAQKVPALKKKAA